MPKLQTKILIPYSKYLYLKNRDRPNSAKKEEENEAKNISPRNEKVHGQKSENVAITDSNLEQTGTKPDKLYNKKPEQQGGGQLDQKNNEEKRNIDIISNQLRNSEGLNAPHAIGVQNQPSLNSSHFEPKLIDVDQKKTEEKHTEHDSEENIKKTILNKVPEKLKARLEKFFNAIEQHKDIIYFDKNDALYINEKIVPGAKFSKLVLLAFSYKRKHEPLCGEKDFFANVKKINRAASAITNKHKIIGPKIIANSPLTTNQIKQYNEWYQIL